MCRQNRFTAIYGFVSTEFLSGRLLEKVEGHTKKMAFTYFRSCVFYALSV